MTKPCRKPDRAELPLFKQAVLRRSVPPAIGRNVDCGEAAPIASRRAVEPADTKRKAREQIEPHAGRMWDGGLSARSISPPGRD